MPATSTIRPFHPSDRDEVARICLLTGLAGGDATGVFPDDELLAHVFALPYVTLHPEFAFVVDAGDHLAGYVLGVPDTRAFVERYRREWLPVLSAHGYTDPGPAAPGDRVGSILHRAFHPEQMLIPEVDSHPAHLHIDLLPELQGAGFGRRLIRTQLQAQAAAGVPALHLGLDPANTRAAAFYAHLGFRPLPSAVDEGGPLGIATSASI